MDKLTPSQEDYLETIYRLEQKFKVARVRDIADVMEVSMPSVSGSLKKLKSMGLIFHRKNSYITLTEEGRERASVLLVRYGVIKEFLENILRLPCDRAGTLACRMEHFIDSDTAERFSSLTVRLGCGCEAGAETPLPRPERLDGKTNTMSVRILSESQPLTAPADRPFTK